MAVVEQFDRGMIERYLRTNELKFLRDDDGDYQVDFGYDEETECELSILLAASGSRQSIYTMLVTSSRLVARAEWGRVVAICNEWNELKRWPKAYFHARNLASDSHGAIILEEQIDLSPGIHWELFESWTSLMIGASFQFWVWAHKKRQL
jgi:hypothetical protein